MAFWGIPFLDLTTIYFWAFLRGGARWGTKSRSVNPFGSPHDGDPVSGIWISARFGRTLIRDLLRLAILALLCGRWEPSQISCDILNCLILLGQGRNPVVLLVRSPSGRGKMEVDVANVFEIHTWRRSSKLEVIDTVGCCSKLLTRSSAWGMPPVMFAWPDNLQAQNAFRRVLFSLKNN